MKKNLILSTLIVSSLGTYAFAQDAANSEVTETQNSAASAIGPNAEAAVPDPASAAFTNVDARRPADTPKKKERTKTLFLVKDVPQTVSFDYDIGEIAVGNPGVVSVVADRARRRIVLSPLETGETALLIFDALGKQKDSIQITVTSTDLDQFIRDLKSLFAEIEGLTFRKVGRKVLLEGEVYLKDDLDRIKEVLSGNDFVVNLVTLSQDTQRILARRIKDEININGVEVGTAKGKIVLRGEVASEEESKRAEKVAAIYTDGANIVNVIAINPKKSAARGAKLIQVSAYFVELNKSFLRNFNFAWTPIANAQVAYGSQGFTFFTLLTDFLPKLNTAKALGVARVFENPSISVKSGEAANIRSGGQLYLPALSLNGAVGFSEPKQVGVTLNVTPTADDRDFVDMKISVEVNKPGASTTEGTFLINTSSLSTSQYVRSGETVALGGVIRSAFADIKDSPPNQPFTFAPAGDSGPQFNSSFGNIFQVFKSRSTTSDRNMFIVFITPEVLNSARDSSRQVREQMNITSVEPKAGSAAEDFE